MIELTVGSVEAGKKMHRLVRQLLPGVPLSGIHKMLRTGRVKRNGKKVKPDDIAQLGDNIRLYMAESDYEQVSKPVMKFTRVSSEIDVIYEDDQLLLVNKPVGLLTHGAEGEHKDTLINRVLAYLHRSGQLDSRAFHPSPVNRLDRNTSGIVVIGKSGDAMRCLSSQIANHEVRKWYLGILAGRVSERGEISARLSRQDHSNRTEINMEGKEAVTRFLCKAQTKDTSVVQIELVSGRTHQIRAHFSHIKHPLWGDVKYGGRAERKIEGQHQWLHAAWLQLADGRRFHAPLPRPFVVTLYDLGYTNQQIAEIQAFIEM